MSFCDNGLLTNKSIMVFIPHPDDELNLMGGFLEVISSITKNIHIVYSTNGDYRYDKYIRLNEALNACKVFSIPEENIHFLGYPDTPNRVGKHVFYSYEAPFITNEQTYESIGLKGHEEWRWKLSGEHSSLTRVNLRADIETIIQYYKPDLIFCNDFEHHADHRCLSILFDEAISLILHQDKMYNPIVYKGFCYNTAFSGEDIYTVYNLKTCQACKLENPMYRWEERCQFSSASEVSLLIRSKLFRSLNCHKTQLAICHAKSIIHSDQVFWLRRTDNLALNAYIEVSTGDPLPLNDFKIIDSNDILKEPNEDCVINTGIWIPDPEDIYPTIQIRLKMKYLINRICLHVHLFCNWLTLNIRIILDNNQYLEFKNICIKESGAYNLYFTDIYVKNIIIILEKVEKDFTFGITEVEVFEFYLPSIKYFYSKINECSTNVYYISSDTFINITAVGIDQKGSYYHIDDKEISIILDNVTLENYAQGILIKKFHGKKRLIIKLKDNPELFNIIELCYINKIKRYLVEAFSNFEYRILLMLEKWLRNKKLRKEAGF